MLTSQQELYLRKFTINILYLLIYNIKFRFTGQMYKCWSFFILCMGLMNKCMVFEKNWNRGLFLTDILKCFLLEICCKFPGIYREMFSI
jgi:hypothetical protein